MIWSTLLGGLLVLGLVTPAAAGSPTEQVRQYSDEVLRVLADPALKLADKRAAIRRVADEIFDVQETAKRALGPHWLKRTPAEREEFVQLFADLLERTYVTKVDLYGGERLRYTNEIVDGDFAVVRARIVTRQGAEVPVDARMRRRDERWLIYDIAIEGVSLVANYRAQFDRVIRTSSYEELVRRLKIKRDEFLPRKEAARERS